MTKQEAIQQLEIMPENDFQNWFQSLPQRVQLCVKGGLVDWRETLAEWYLNQLERKQNNQ